MADMPIYQGELVIGDALHQETVVRDQKQRARPCVQQLLDGGQHVGVHVVARLVQDEHVGLVKQDEHKGQTALLTAGQVAHWLVKVGAREAQLLQQLRRRHLLAVEHHAARVVADHLANAVVAEAGEVVQMLRQHRKLHRFADLHEARRGCLHALDHLQKRGFAHAVGADDAVAVARPDNPVDAVEHGRGLAVEAHRDVLQLNHLLAQACHGHAFELQLVTQRWHVGDQLVRGVHAELRLRAASLRAACQPGKLAAQGVLPLLLGQGRQAIALDALQDIRGEAALERLDHAVVHLPHARAHLVQEPAVVRDHQQRALTGAPAVLQMVRQPGDGANIQVVGGFVKRQDVPVADEQAHQVDAAALAAGKRAHLRVPGDVAGKARDDVADARIAGPFVLGDVAHHGALDGVVVIELVELPQHAHAHGAVAQHTALVGLEHARHHRQQRGLAVAVAAHNADAIALINAQRHAFEHRFRGEIHAHFLAAQHKRHRYQLPCIYKRLGSDRAETKARTQPRTCIDSSTP